MSAPVDVLAVLRQTAIGVHGVADECTNSEFAIVMNQRAQAMDAASAVVAELIAASTTVERRATRHTGDDRMFDRLRAALARVGGAS